MKIEVVCDHCGITFLRERKTVNQNIKDGFKQFCCLECQRAHRSKTVELICPSCGKVFIRAPSDIKSDTPFCSKVCAAAINQTQKRKGTFYKETTFNYRRRALNYYGIRCSVCGYDIECVLEVHHKDGNRKNNALDNLDVLCPTHHTEYEKGIREY